jgi:hypothetical protein
MDTNPFLTYLKCRLIPFVSIRACRAVGIARAGLFVVAWRISKRKFFLPSVHLNEDARVPHRQDVCVPEFFTPL